MDKINRRAKKTSPLGGKTDAPLAECIKALQERVLAHPPTGKEADKEFFDWLSSDD